MEKEHYYLVGHSGLSRAAKRYLSTILPARVANQHARFGSSYPLTELAIQ